MNSLSTCSSLPEQNQSIILHAVISAILNLSVKNCFFWMIFQIVFPNMKPLLINHS